jgi:hypothetical protein
VLLTADVLDVSQQVPDITQIGPNGVLRETPLGRQITSEARQHAGKNRVQFPVHIGLIALIEGHTSTVYPTASRLKHPTRGAPPTNALAARRRQARLRTAA